jgi:hypothetical protein
MWQHPRCVRDQKNECWIGKRRGDFGAVGWVSEIFEDEDEDVVRV